MTLTEQDALSVLPVLTANLPGVGGRIKVEPEDFVVEESLNFISQIEGGA